MSIYKSAINRPVTTLLVFVAVIVIGVFSFLRLPIDQFPEMDPPYISVLTVYPGASASEIETNVTKIIENNLNSVDYLKEITSTTKDNISVVLLELEWGTDLDEIINDVRSYIDMVKDELPDGCTNPFIFKFSTSSMPILQYSITADESYPGLDKLLNDEIIPQLSMVNGIGNLTLSGSPERYVYVDIDQQKLDAYGLPLETVGSAIAANNLNLSSGTVKMNKEQYQLEVRSEYVESSEINDIVVTVTPEGRQVFVRDLATVRDTIKDLSLDEKTNGRESVRLMVTKQTGANTVQICEDLEEEMARIERTLPNDIKIEVIYDSSEDIVNSINSLEESILYALLFVVLVVLFFLGEWRSTLIISLTIPISLIVAFIYLMLADSSLNIISLSSLTVAIGMATTLVIVVVFVPLTMLTGMAGIMFKELGWLVTIMVCTSTVVAISLTPMLCSKLLKARPVRVNERGVIENIPPKRNWYQRYVIPLLDRLDKAYARLLRFCLRHKAWTLVAISLFFIASIMPFLMGKVGTDFIQETDNGRLTVDIELATGYRIEETAKMARYIESRFYELVPEIELISTSAGTTDDDGVSAMFSTTMNNTMSMTVVCNKKNERDRSIFEIAEVLRQELASYPEIIDYQCGVSSFMGGASSTVDVEIYGYSFDETNAFAQEVRAAIRDNVYGARDIDISREKDRPEIKINLDKEKLAYHGLNSSTVSTYVRNRVNGMASGYLKEDGDEYDIVVRLQEEDRNSISDIENMTIPTATGSMIKIKELGRIEEYFAPPTIERKSRQRVVTVSVTPYETSLGELAAGIQQTIDQMGVPSGITVRLAGNYEDQQDTFQDLLLLLALIIMLIYIVLASQFESFVKPVMIMTAVPFALSGVVLALWITGTTLDMIGSLGFIMLVGIATKNAIVLVDYTNLMRDRGYELNEAIALSGASRLRPVLMTAITTFLGMLPMAMSNGEGAEMWKPMGIVVIGGLLVSTVVTLVVVPVFYALLSRHGERNKDKKTRAQFIFMQLSPNPEGEDPEVRRSRELNQ